MSRFASPIKERPAVVAVNPVYRKQELLANTGYMYKKGVNIRGANIRGTGHRMDIVVDGQKESKKLLSNWKSRRKSIMPMSKLDMSPLDFDKEDRTLKIKSALPPQAKGASGRTPSPNKSFRLVSASTSPRGLPAGQLLQQPSLFLSSPVSGSGTGPRLTRSFSTGSIRSASATSTIGGVQPGRGMENRSVMRIDLGSSGASLGAQHSNALGLQSTHSALSSPTNLSRSNSFGNVLSSNSTVVQRQQRMMRERTSSLDNLNIMGESGASAYSARSVSPSVHSLYRSLSTLSHGAGSHRIHNIQLSQQAFRKFRKEEIRESIEQFLESNTFVLETEWGVENASRHGSVGKGKGGADNLDGSYEEAMRAADAELSVEKEEQRMEGKDYVKRKKRFDKMCTMFRASVADELNEFRDKTVEDMFFPSENAFTSPIVTSARETLASLVAGWVQQSVTAVQTLDATQEELERAREYRRTLRGELESCNQEIESSVQRAYQLRDRIASLQEQLHGASPQQVDWQEGERLIRNHENKINAAIFSLPLPFRASNSSGGRSVSGMGVMSGNSLVEGGSTTLYGTTANQSRSSSPLFHRGGYSSSSTKHLTLVKVGPGNGSADGAVYNLASNSFESNSPFAPVDVVRQRYNIPDPLAVSAKTAAALSPLGAFIGFNGPNSAGNAAGAASVFSGGSMGSSAGVRTGVLGSGDRRVLGDFMDSSAAAQSITAAFSPLGGLMQVGGDFASTENVNTSTAPGEEIQPDSNTVDLSGMPTSFRQPASVNMNKGMHDAAGGAGSGKYETRGMNYTHSFSEDGGSYGFGPPLSPYGRQHKQFPRQQQQLQTQPHSGTTRESVRFFGSQDGGEKGAGARANGKDDAVQSQPAAKEERFNDAAEHFDFSVLAALGGGGDVAASQSFASSPVKPNAAYWDAAVGSAGPAVVGRLGRESSVQPQDITGKYTQQEEGNEERGGPPAERRMSSRRGSAGSISAEESAGGVSSVGRPAGTVGVEEYAGATLRGAAGNISPLSRLFNAPLPSEIIPQAQAFNFSSHTANLSPAEYAPAQQQQQQPQQEQQGGGRGGIDDGDARSQARGESQQGLMASSTVAAGSAAVRGQGQGPQGKEGLNRTISNNSIQSNSTINSSSSIGGGSLANSSALKTYSAALYATKSKPSSSDSTGVSSDRNDHNEAAGGAAPMEFSFQNPLNRSASGNFLSSNSAVDGGTAGSRREILLPAASSRSRAAVGVGSSSTDGVSAPTAATTTAATTAAVTTAAASSEGTLYRVDMRQLQQIPSFDQFAHPSGGTYRNRNN